MYSNSPLRRCPLGYQVAYPNMIFWEPKCTVILTLDVFYYRSQKHDFYCNVMDDNKFDLSLSCTH